MPGELSQQEGGVEGTLLEARVVIGEGQVFLFVCEFQAKLSARVGPYHFSTQQLGHQPSKPCPSISFA